MEFQKTLVTPEIARGYLSKNKNNRPVKKPNVLRLANEMKNGLWKEDTGEMIKISKSGNVLDGQHRLMAVIESGVSVFIHFAFGLEDDIFSVLDTGSLRNASDSFYVSGVKNSTSIPSIITLHYVLKSGAKDTYTQKNNKLSNTELLQKYNENSDFWDEVATKAQTLYQAFARILPPQTIGGIYSLAKQVDGELADKFMDELCKGFNVTNHTVNLLRSALIKDKMSVRKMPMQMKLALIIKSWNFYKNNINTKVLKWDSSIEKFPKIS